MYSSARISVLLTMFLLSACNVTSLDVASAKLGQRSEMQSMLAVIDAPGPIKFGKHLAATWKVDLEGLLNLDHPEAIAAGLENREEPIELYVYTLEHPKYGNFLVDSGISERFESPGQNTDLGFLVRQVFKNNMPSVVKTTQRIAESYADGIQGVFLTHIHLDHIFGLKDLPVGTPVYLGAGDTGMRSMEYVVTQGTTDRLLGHVETLLEWDYPQSGDSLPSLIDIFGDGSVWAIHSPGHTPGNTSYLVRTTQGTQLLLGDACHTRWGWEHGVEPGTFSTDQARSAESLDKLIDLVEAHPSITVHPGHQSLK